MASRRRILLLALTAACLGALAATPLWFDCHCGLPPAGPRGIDPPAPSAVVPDPTPVDRLLRSRGTPGATRGNRIALLTSGETAYRRLIERIRSAARTIYISTYILEPDATGHEVLLALTERARSGVRVRLLFDGIGSWRLAEGDYAALASAGGRVAVYKPIARLAVEPEAAVRYHRKIAVIDGEWAFSGGGNLASEYLGQQASPQRWTELAFEVEGPAAADYDAIFRADWASAARETLAPPAPPPAAGDAVAQVVASGPRAPGRLRDALIEAAAGARSRLLVVTPYFVPDGPMTDALLGALKRGVEVSVLMPAHSDHVALDLARRKYLRRIESAGGRVLLLPTMLHAKATIVDDSVAVIGSTNMDRRSLLINKEADLLIYSGPQIAEVRAWAEGLLAQAKPRRVRPGLFDLLVEELVHLVSSHL
ncbi:MAG: Cardiolipin synthase A [Phycisphaerae bacterium]|nr:Cardiolipin synthase A [Phycisphaerae bacterium]